VIDFNILHDLITSKPKTYTYLGNIPLYGADMFLDMDDVMDFVYDDERYAVPEVSMFELHNIQHRPNCPTMIKELAAKLKKFKPYNSTTLDVVGFVGITGATGYHWHYDNYHLIAMNIIGNTTWEFKDGNKVKMAPGDLMFVPSPIEHVVMGEGERFTISFCCFTTKMQMIDKAKNDTI
jgi:quercetin dioxygenase-like cupin family protein